MALLIESYVQYAQFLRMILWNGCIVTMTTTDVVSYEWPTLWIAPQITLTFDPETSKSITCLQVLCLDYVCRFHMF